MHFPIISYNEEKKQAEVIDIEVRPRLDVVLIPGSMVRSMNFTEELKQNLPDLYDQIKQEEWSKFAEMKKRIAQRRPAVTEYANRRLQELKQEFEAGRLKESEYSQEKSHYEETITLHNEDLSKYDPDTFFDKYNFWNTHAEGLYVGWSLDLKKRTDEQGMPYYERRFYIPIAVPESGNSVTLDPNRSSFYNPAEFKMLTDIPDMEYPLQVPAEVRKSHVIRHEFRHHVSAHPLTDYMVLANYQQAYDRFLQGDDSLFYFVFETPRGNVVASRTDGAVV